MTNTVKQGIAWAQSPAAATRGGADWRGWCQSAAVRFAGAPGGFDTATDCREASRILDTDPSTAPAGALHWWWDEGAKSTGDGHVGVSLGGGRCFMASTTIDHSVVPAVDVWHPHLGVIDVHLYNHIRPAEHYAGWSLDLGGTVMAGVSVIVKVAGDPRLWLISGDLTRHHLTPHEWARAKKRGAHYRTITRAALKQFPVGA